MSRTTRFAQRCARVLGVLVVLAALLPGAQAQGSGKQNSAAPATNAPTANAPGGVVDVTTFILGAGDTISIDVFGQPNLSRAHKIRSDGMISIPMVGDIQAAGLTPQKLSRQIEQALGEKFQEPVATVDVLDVQSKTFTLTGGVLRPGPYPMPNPITVFDAINYGGGFKDFADKKKIRVIRVQADGKPPLILFFNYEDYTKAKNMEKNKNFMIENKDTIIIKE